MRAHLVQSDITWEDKDANHERLGAMLADAGVEPGDLVVLPEMFDTGFSLNLEATGVDPERSEAFVVELARSTRATVVGGYAAAGPDGRGRNRTLVAGPGGDELARYDKIHPFSFGREGERFDGGDRVVAFDWVGPEGERLRVCPVTCYDLRFPELFRAGLEHGAEAFTVIANWPSPRRDHWRALLIARAIENQAFVFGVNRSGVDPNVTYAGGSLGVDPRGRVLGEGGREPEVVSVEADPSRVGAWREAFPALRDRRRFEAGGRVSDGVSGGGVAKISGSEGSETR